MSGPILSRRRLLGAGALGTGGLLLSGRHRLNRSAAFRDALQGAEGLHMRAQRLIAGDALAREYAEAQMSPEFRANGNRDVAAGSWIREELVEFRQT